MKLPYPWLAIFIVAAPVYSTCPDRLADVLQSRWAEPSARLGIVVKSKDKVLVNINGDQAFIPASLQKLFTTAGALNSLGNGFRVKTVLTMSEQGELKLIGGGDPSFSSDRDLPRLVAQLSRGDRPIKSIQIVPGSWGNSYGRGWEWSDLQEPYAAPIGGVVIDENILEWQLSPQFSWKYPRRAMGWQVKNETKLGQKDTLEIQTRGKILSLRGMIPEPIDYATPIPDPEEQFLTLLRQELNHQGVEGLKPGQGVVFSSPLPDLIKTTNKDSHNLYAEQILRILGKFYALPGHDYETGGREIITRQFQSPGFYLADGSGLSRRNQATPSQIVDLLVRMKDNPFFRASLPIGGKDGTLTHRLKHLNIQAKTGTLTGISTLAGYLLPPKHPPITFAILVNHSLKPSAELRTTIDAIVTEMNQLKLCEP